MKNKLYHYQNHLQEQLQNEEFKKVWLKSEPEYQLACQLMELRLKNKLSQRNLAKKLKTSQAVVSRIETMTANPSLSLLKRITWLFNTKLVISLGI